MGFSSEGSNDASGNAFCFELGCASAMTELVGFALERAREFNPGHSPFALGAFGIGSTSDAFAEALLDRGFAGEDAFASAGRRLALGHVLIAVRDEEALAEA